MFFKWEDNQVKLSPETLAIRVFKEIWESDKSKGKGVAMSIFSYLYFMHDPRSHYQVETDAATRSRVIKEHLGLKIPVESNPLYLSAVPVYLELTRTTSSEILSTQREVFSRVKVYLESVTVTDDNINKVVKAMSDLNSLAIEMSKAGKVIHEEVETQLSKARGKARLTIGDEGLDKLFTV